MKKYYLYRGDIRLGTVTHMEDEFPWHVGSFDEETAFSEVRQLFNKERKYHADVTRELWQQAWNEIIRPGLRLDPVEGGQSLFNPLIHIDGTSVWWRGGKETKDIKTNF